MADSTEIAAATTPAPENSSATSTAPEIKRPEMKRFWGDEAEENPDEPDGPSAADGESSTSQLPVDQLSIKDRKDLDEPEDSNIQAVTSFC